MKYDTLLTNFTVVLKIEDGCHLPLLSMPCTTEHWVSSHTLLAQQGKQVPPVFTGRIKIKNSVCKVSTLRNQLPNLSWLTGVTIGVDVQCTHLITNLIKRRCQRLTTLVFLNLKIHLVSVLLRKSYHSVVQGLLLMAVTMHFVWSLDQRQIRWQP